MATMGIALVTGASGGIGRAVVRALVRGGATVVAQYHAHRDPVDALRAELGERVIVEQADLRDPVAATRLVDGVVARFGALQVLVNGAGAIRDDLLAVAEIEDFRALLDLNYLAAVACARAAVRPMMRQRFGRIVNLSSVAAHVPGRGQSNYAGTKGALEAFTRALAVELGPKGITVNAVAPGVIETAMSEEIRALAGDSIRERTALGRFGTAAEVAAAVAFLASEEAGFITGQTLRVDGGFKLR
ncbi:MAG: SDR family oxidoreductase [Myxococcales bacterium]|nr:SDR family oxidoreductase [Myxococcales bacterium]